SRSMRDSAIKWYRKAASGGSVWAQMGLGDIYAFSCSNTKELDEARFWYQAAANQHAQEAREAIARLNDGKGRSCSADLVETAGKAGTLASQAAVASQCSHVSGEWQWHTGNIPGVLSFDRDHMVGASATRGGPPLLRGTWSCNA